MRHIVVRTNITNLAIAQLADLMFKVNYKDKPESRIYSLNKPFIRFSL